MLPRLSPRYETVAEPAREMITEHRQTGGEVTLNERPEVFVEKLICAINQRLHGGHPPGSGGLRPGPDCVAYAVP